MLGPLVHDLLARSAESAPERPLVIDAGRRFSYGEILEGASRVARVLIDHGIRRGDRVGLIADNSRVYVESYYGILRAGAVVVSLSTASDSGTQAKLLGDCGARALVCGPRQGRTVTALLDHRDLEFILGPVADDAIDAARRGRCRLLDAPAALRSAPPEPPGVPLVDLDRAAIVYTSGSTGRPRGAVLRHLNVVSNTRSIVRYLELSAEDRVFVVLPFHYVYGKSLLNTHVAVGGSVVIENRFLYPQEALDHLEREEATGFSPSCSSTRSSSLTGLPQAPSRHTVTVTGLAAGT